MTKLQEQDARYLRSAGWTSERSTAFRYVLWRDPLVPNPLYFQSSAVWEQQRRDEAAKQQES